MNIECEYRNVLLKLSRTLSRMQALETEQAYKNILAEIQLSIKSAVEVPGE